MFIKDVHHPQCDAVVVLQPDLVGQDKAGIFVEHSCADGAQRILVTQFCMDAFPNAETEVGTDVEIMWTVGVGVGDHRGKVDRVRKTC